jgi:alpha-L-arabinofuranosidase
MKKFLFSTILLFICGILYSQKTESVRINIDANIKIAGVTELFNGANIEDVNNQTNGGIFSQLIHGEAFEENIEPDFLNLNVEDYSKIYVFLDERKIPHLISQSNVYNRIPWNNITEKYDVYSKDVYSQNLSRNPDIISGWRFPGRFLPFDSLPANIQKIMLERVNGNEQVSKFWNKHISGNPQYCYTLERNYDAYMGRQTQVMAFTGGSGEVGITNHGLYKQGIRFDSGKSYDGILRIKAGKPTTIYISLRDEKGKLLVEKPYQLKGDNSYEKVEYELIPNGSAKKGSIGVSLKNPGEVRLGFMFLQPGTWGRVPDGWPIRTMFTDALKRQGITAIRYNGSMVDVSVDSYLYRWKKMIGPIDERRVCLRNGFNLYATHSYGFIEMLQAAEAIGAEAILGMSMDETYEDIKDFVEYVNGPVTSVWGALRAKHGHPEPYRLKYIQVDNERNISPGYVECMKKFALAAWEADPEMSIMTSLNLGDTGYRRDDSDVQAGRAYKLTSEMVGWFIAQGRGDKLTWDPHYGGQLLFADGGEAYLNEMGIILQKELAKDYPGFWLKLHPMEENEGNCDWRRGLAHAHNWNTNQRYGNSFVMLGTANTFQPHGLHYMWNQGRIHYTSDTIWFQPSAYIDEIMKQTWKPNVVNAGSSADSLLDVTAKINDAKTELTIYIVNLSEKPQDAIINIDNFKFNTKADVITIGDCDLTEYNTYNNMNNVVPVRKQTTINRKDAKYTFPRYSYTVITLKK